MKVKSIKMIISLLIITLTAPIFITTISLAKEQKEEENKNVIKQEENVIIDQNQIPQEPDTNHTNSSNITQETNTNKDNTISEVQDEETKEIEENEAEEIVDEKLEEVQVEEEPEEETQIENQSITIPDATKKVQTGEYEIYTCLNETKVVEVIGSSKTNGANAEIYERGNQNNQKFKIQLNSDGTYTFLALHSNKVLDVCVANGNVSQYEAHGGDNQKWYLKECGDGYYYIISKANGWYLDVDKGQGKDCQNIQVYTGHGEKSQKFKFSNLQSTTGSRTIKDGIYHIKSQVASNRLLEVPNNQTNNDVKIQTGVNKNLASQKFQVTYQKDGTYIITAIHSGKALDVQYGNGKNGTPVLQYAKHGGASQKWVILENSNGTYSLIACCNGLALDVKSANTNIGASLQTYCFHGQKSQQFTFETCGAETGSQLVEDGTYRILSSVDHNKGFKIRDNNNGAPLQMWENTKSLQQKFDIEYTGQGYYKIKTKASNQVLTVESENPKVGSIVTQQKDNDLDTQKWILKKYEQSVYAIISKCGNLYITISNYTIQNGQNLQLGSPIDLAPQRFILINETPKEKISTKIEEGVYQIVTKGNRVLDVVGGTCQEAANIAIWNNQKGQNQKYQITKIGNTGYYKIIAIHSGRSLDVQGANTNLGANIIQYSYANTNNQQWLLKDAGDGYYHIVAKESGLYLDIQNRSN